VRKWLTISLIFQKSLEDEAYPIQTLRNLAKSLAKGHLFLLDVDFIPSPRLAERAMARVQLYAKQRPGVKVAFIVPAFEPTERRLATSRLPSDKDTLLLEVKAGLIQPILGGFHASHISTNYVKWYSTKLDYAISYEVLFEPYVIATSPGVPEYDERFNEYGNDKCSHIYEMAACRYQFVVIGDSYVVHMEHKQADFKDVQDVDKSWDNWAIYADEIEMRYHWRPEVPDRLMREVELGNLPGKWMLKPAVGLGPVR